MTFIGYAWAFSAAVSNAAIDTMRKVSGILFLSVHSVFHRSNISQASHCLDRWI